MKKNLIAVAVLATSVFGAASVFAADGQVDFTGEIIDAACTIVNTPANPLKVNLGKVAKSSFVQSGDKSSATKFTLQLKDCPATVSTAMVKFDGTSADGNNTLLKLTQESGVAKGVAIELADDTGAPLPLYTASKAYDLVAGAGVMNNLDFVARYVATSNTVTAGPANSVASFTVNYN